MITGVAFGGPRDGIKLTAEITWDGIVRYSTPKSQPIPYPGKYVFDYENGRWKWVPDPPFRRRS